MNRLRSLALIFGEDNNRENRMQSSVQVDLLSKPRDGVLPSREHSPGPWSPCFPMMMAEGAWLLLVQIHSFPCIKQGKPG